MLKQIPLCIIYSYVALMHDDINLSRQKAFAQTFLPIFRLSRTTMIKKQSINQKGKRHRFAFTPFPYLGPIKRFAHIFF
ncbi:MAG: hypothetical protein ABSB40_05385 [Nitrososphaeria archaeon]|jgi:hypothetical protein